MSRSRSDGEGQWMEKGVEAAMQELLSALSPHQG